MPLSERVKALKREALTLWIAAHDPRTPWLAKLLAGAVATYAFSPIDLIPDFIPVLGLLDDVVIVPLGVLAVMRLIPAPLLVEYRAESAKPGERPVSRTALVAIAFFWIAAATGIAWLLLR